jgi:drug/metabolite transporter (DMT)-like permease
VTRSRTRGLLLATVASVTWGTVPVAGTIALGGITAPLLCSIRLLVATGFLAFVLTRRGVRPFRRPPRLIYLAALGLAANYLFYMWGLERAGAATSQVLIQTAPLSLIVLGVAWLKERLTLRQIAGGVVALLGVFLVSWDDAAGVPHRGLGVLLILAASFTWGVYGAAHRRLGDDHASGPTMMWIFLLAALATVPFAFTEVLRRPDPVHLAAIAYLCLNTIPVVTFGLLLVTNRLDQDYIPHEPLTALKIAGAALVISGVCAAVTARR